MSDHLGHGSGEHNNFCNECGYHYGYHDYEKHSSYGSSGLGGSTGAQFVFLLFIVAGIFFGALFPPLGALIIFIGAGITKV